MNSISVCDLLLIIYVLVDDWYQVQAADYRKGRPGKRPDLSDSEVMALMLAMDYIPFPSERQFVAYLRANHLALFPDLVDQSQFNRRARAVAPLLEQFRQTWLMRLGITLTCEGLLDTKPIPVITVEANSGVIFWAVPHTGTVPARKCTISVTNWLRSPL